MRRFFRADNLPFSFTSSVIAHIVILLFLAVFYRFDPVEVGRVTSGFILSDEAKFYTNPDFRKSSGGGHTATVQPSPGTAERSSVADTKEDDDIRPDDIVIDNKKTASAETKSDTRSALEKLSDYMKGGDDEHALFGNGETKGSSASGGGGDASGIQWDGNARGMPVYRDDPVYPAALAGSGTAGTVLVSVKVSPDGRVFSPTVIKSSGYNDFDKNAVAAARTYRFRPVAGDRIDTGTITIRFVPK